MKIVIFESEPWERPTFAGLGRAHTLVYVDEKLNPRTADSHADADIISTFIYSALDCDTLQRFKQLKLIATRSTGFDHIDPALCKERGVKIANVPGYGENTVAEHVFGLLLAISHRLVEAVDRTRRGDFSLNGLCGFDLCGKTMPRDSA
jgi:D-lactate dehydrogenase